MGSTMMARDFMVQFYWRALLEGHHDAPAFIGASVLILANLMGFLRSAGRMN